MLCSFLSIKISSSIVRFNRIVYDVVLQKYSNDQIIIMTITIVVNYIYIE